MTEQERTRRCQCIALGHDHEPWKCQRESRVMGGDCDDCKKWPK